jgi:hypothetical protein
MSSAPTQRQPSRKEIYPAAQCTWRKKRNKYPVQQTWRRKKISELESGEPLRNCGREKGIAKRSTGGGRG